MHKNISFVNEPHRDNGDKKTYLEFSCFCHCDRLNYVIDEISRKLIEKTKGWFEEVCCCKVFHPNNIIIIKKDIPVDSVSFYNTIQWEVDTSNKQMTITQTRFIIQSKHLFQ